MIREDTKNVVLGITVVVTGAVIVDLWRLWLGNYLKARELARVKEAAKEREQALANSWT